MRTNIEIDDAVLKRIMKRENIATKKEAVNAALHFMDRIRAQSEIRKLWGKIEFDKDFDYKKMRESRFPDWDK